MIVAASARPPIALKTRPPCDISLALYAYVVAGSAVGEVAQITVAIDEKARSFCIRTSAAWSALPTYLSTPAQPRSSRTAPLA